MPFQLEQAGQEFSARQVFAHWHVFPVSPDNRPTQQDAYTTQYLNPDGFDGKFRKFGGYMRERPLPRDVRSESDWYVTDMVEELTLASRIGIDAFIFNIVDMPPQPNWAKLLHMLQAWDRIQVPTRIIPSIDCASGVMDGSLDEVSRALSSVASHPGLLRTRDGRMVLGSFFPEKVPTERWDRLLQSLGANGIRVSFLGILLNTRRAQRSLFQLLDRAAEWGVAGEGGLRSLLHRVWRHDAPGVQWGTAVWSQDFRPKDGWYREARNSEAFRLGWESALKSQSPFAHIVSWNDYSEASEIRPSTGIQCSFYDLAAYYIRGYKTGVYPPIERDVLYYFHRVQIAGEPEYSLLQSEKFRLRDAVAPSNDVELLAFLTEPGELEININGIASKRAAPKGVTSFRAPARPGYPRFSLRRSGLDVISFSSSFEIQASGDYEDFLYRGGSVAHG